MQPGPAFKAHRIISSLYDQGQKVLARKLQACMHKHPLALSIQCATGVDKHHRPTEEVVACGTEGRSCWLGACRHAHTHTSHDHISNLCTIQAEEHKPTGWLMDLETRGRGFWLGPCKYAHIHAVPMKMFHKHAQRESAKPTRPHKSLMSQQTASRDACAIASVREFITIDVHASLRSCKSTHGVG